MKLVLRILNFLIIIGLVLFSTSHTGVVVASNNTTHSSFDTTPIPTLILVEATATVDPATIGDTSGVIAIGMIVVFIILAGVLWGSLELRQEIVKNSQSKD